jgi:hypothetical protein
MYIKVMEKETLNGKGEPENYFYLNLTFLIILAFLIYDI